MRTLSVILVLLVPMEAFAQIRTLGEFEDLQLFLDTQVEGQPENNKVTTSGLLRSGETVQIQIFLPEAGGKETLGYNLEFAVLGGSYSTYFDLPLGVDWNGRPLIQTEDQPILSALLINKPTVVSNGYLGELTIRARKNIPEGTVLILKNATMAGPSRDDDPLNTSETNILFTSFQFIEGLKGDLDRDGDVDFSDFLTFAGNFGKTGPVPSEARTVLRTLTVHDTILITSTDTISVTEVDTLVFTNIDTVRSLSTDTTVVVIRDTTEIVRTVHDTTFITLADTIYTTRIDTFFQATGILDRLPERDWTAIISEERNNVYWLGIGVEESGFNWIFVGTGFAVAVDAICTNAHVVTALSDVLKTIQPGLTPIAAAIPANSRGSDAYRLLISDNSSVSSFSHPLYDGTTDSPDVALVFTDRQMASISRLVSSVDAMEIQVGQEITTLGFPGEFESNYDPITRPIPTSKTGRISALRPYNPTTFTVDLWGLVANKILQHDFDTTGGTSGSPIFNKRGEVIAVHNSGFGQGSLGFGIRADEVRVLLQAVSVKTRGTPDFFSNINATKPAPK